MILAILPLVIFFVLLFVNEKYAVMVLTFICIFIPSAVQLGSLPIRTVAIVIFSVYFIGRLVLFKSERKNIVKLPIKGILIFLLVVLLLVTFLNAGVGFYKLLVEMISKFFLGLIVWVTFKKEKDTRFAFRYLLRFFYAICIYGFFCLFTNSNPYIEFVGSHFQDTENIQLIFNYNQETHRGDTRSRDQSVFNHPIRYGGHLAMVAPFLIWLIFNSKKKRNYYLILLGMVVVNIVLSNSRSGMLELLVSSVIMFLLFKPRHKIVTVLSLCVLFFLAIWASPLFSDYSQTLASVFQTLSGQTTTAVGGSSISLRLAQLATTYLIFIQSPYFGHGIGYTASLVISGSVTGLHGAESFLFQLMMDAGIIGICGYILFFFFLVRYFFKLRKAPAFKQYGYLINSTIAMIGGYIIFILATGELDTFYFFFFLVALSIRTLVNENFRDQFNLFKYNETVQNA